MQDIIDLLVAKNDISIEEAGEFVVKLFSLIEKGLSVDELTKVKDLGTFKLTHIQERESVDVNTKEKIVIPAHRRVSFIPAQLLKTLVNKPFAHFETTPLNEGVFEEGIPENNVSDKDVDDEDDYVYQDEEPIEENVSTKEEDIAEAKSILKTTEKELNKKLEEHIVPFSTPTSAVEKKKEPSINKEGPIDDRKEAKKENVVTLSRKPSTVRLKVNRKTRYYIFIGVAIALFIFLVVGFAYNYYNSSNSLNQFVEIIKTNNTTDEPSVASFEVHSKESETLIDSVKTVETTKVLPRKKAKMSPGRTLRLIALDKLGDREFWVYIYMVNKEKIENPNVVPIGLVLDLPYQNEYPMDASNSEDVARAKRLGDELIKSFG